MTRARLLLCILLLVATLPAAPAVADGHTVTDGTTSSFDGTTIAWTLFRPAGASADAPAPMVLHSHGWGGSRSTSGFEAWLDQGFGVLSFDQRGFGESGGQANVQDPEFEARDVRALVDDVVLGQDWVARDAADPADPVLFAIGGSYGGGYQWLTALSETADHGETRFDALAPEISWFDLSDALAPSGVVRTAWVVLLYAVGAQTLPTYVHRAFAYGATTGQWPDGTVPEPLVPDMEAKFFQHGPSGFVADGVLLDVPVLVRQGATDTLFDLNQGLHNLARTLTDRARGDSLFVGYNGGHVLPAVLPAGTGGDGDPCSDGSASGGFEQLTRDFFRTVVEGGDTTALLPAQVNLATPDGTCLHVEALEHRTVEADGPIGSTSGIGVPQHVPIAQGPVTVAGIPTMDATVTSVGADQRLLLGLAVGASATDAAVVGGQLLPIRELLPVVGEEREDVELPAVAVEVPAGQTLFLTVSPVVDTYVGHGSIRSPGAILLEDVAVHLPTPVPPGDDTDDPTDPDPDPDPVGDRPGRGHPDDPGRPDHAGGPGGRDGRGGHGGGDRGADPRGAWWHAQIPAEA